MTRTGGWMWILASLGISACAVPAEDLVSVTMAVRAQGHRSLAESDVLEHLARAGLTVEVTRAQTLCAKGTCEMVLDAVVDRYLLRELRGFKDDVVEIESVDLSNGSEATLTPAPEGRSNKGSIHSLGVFAE